MRGEVAVRVAGVQSVPQKSPVDPLVSCLLSEVACRWLHLKCPKARRGEGAYTTLVPIGFLLGAFPVVWPGSHRYSLSPPGLASSPRLNEKLLHTGDIPGIQCVPKFRQVLKVNSQYPAEVMFVGEGDVPPDFGRPGGHPGGVPEAGSTQGRLFRRMNRAQDIVGQSRRNDMGKMAGATDQVIMLRRRK